MTPGPGLGPQGPGQSGLPLELEQLLKQNSSHNLGDTKKQGFFKKKDVSSNEAFNPLAEQIIGLKDDAEILKAVKEYEIPEDATKDDKESIQLLKHFLPNRPGLVAALGAATTIADIAAKIAEDIDLAKKDLIHKEVSNDTNTENKAQQASDPLVNIYPRGKVKIKKADFENFVPVEKNGEFTGEIAYNKTPSADGQSIASRYTYNRTGTQPSYTFTETTDGTKVYLADVEFTDQPKSENAKYKLIEIEHKDSEGKTIKEQGLVKIADDKGNSTVEDYAISTGAGTVSLEKALMHTGYLTDRPIVDKTETVHFNDVQINNFNNPDTHQATPKPDGSYQAKAANEGVVFDLTSKENSKINYDLKKLPKIRVKDDKGTVIQDKYAKDNTFVLFADPKTSSILEGELVQRNNEEDLVIKNEKTGEERIISKDNGLIAAADFQAFLEDLPKSKDFTVKRVDKKTGKHLPTTISKKDFEFSLGYEIKSQADDGVVKQSNIRMIMNPDKAHKVIIVTEDPNNPGQVNPADHTAVLSSDDIAAGGAKLGRNLVAKSNLEDAFDRLPKSKDMEGYGGKNDNESESRKRGRLLSFFGGKSAA